ncbi:hypothetical protein [Nocardia sp. NPDC049707]|uniref:hypothetical protein n=1 Tax=Nocardia sp. NPDC049707 TaxID=3154735 RepID=UPI003433D062
MNAGRDRSVPLCVRVPGAARAIRARRDLGGHGATIACVIVDGGTFDWTVRADDKPRFPGFSDPDPSYPGVVYAASSAPSLRARGRVQLPHDLGSSISSLNMFLIGQGLETLTLRI